MTRNTGKVRVLSSHIQSAIPQDSARCMIADAIKDAFPGCQRVSVDLQTIRYTDSENVRRTYLTPGHAQSALARFDDGLPIEPFTMVLGNPIHVSPADDARRGHGNQGPSAKRQVSVTHDRSPRSLKVRVSGGRAPAMTKRGSRRVFGMRGLRINEKGEVQQ